MFRHSPHRSAHRRHGGWTARIALPLVAAVACLPARAFDNQVHRLHPNQGDIDFSLFFMFPPSETDLDAVKAGIEEANALLCDATDAQMRFGTVKLRGGAGTAGKGESTVWLSPTNGRANADVCLTAGDPCIGLEMEDRHVRMFMPLDPYTLAHEMGHHALGLGDEYAENPWGGHDGGIGRCIECEEQTEQHNCLMQGSNACTEPGEAPDVLVSELCTPDGHDLVGGDPTFPDCLEGTDFPDICVDRGDDFCGLYNPSTCDYQGAHQTWWSHHKTGEVMSCWHHVDWYFPFLDPPGSLPKADPPDAEDCPPPVFDDSEVMMGDQVVLVLDRSWSMNFDPDGGQCHGWPGPQCPEICDNGHDDDDDGVEDEEECTTGRMERLQQAAAAFIDFSTVATGNTLPTLGLLDPFQKDVGIVSFACGTTLEAPVEALTEDAADALKQIVAGLQPGGSTDIGGGLARAREELTALDGHRAVFLITDGQDTCGTIAPADEIQNVLDADIAVYSLTLGSEGDEALAEMARRSHGLHREGLSFEQILPSVATQFAAYSGIDVLIPRLQYRLDAESSIPEPFQHARGSEAWLDGDDLPLGDPGPGTPVYGSNLFQLRVEPGTRRLVIQAGGDMDKLDGFGVRMILHGPAGPGPDQVDSEGTLDPSVELRDGEHYRMLSLVAPNPGEWWLEVLPIVEPGIAQVQTGSITVLADAPDVEFEVALDRTVVVDASEPIRISVSPTFVHRIHAPESIEGRVRRPDGSWVDVVLTESDVLGGYYGGEFGALGLQGDYELRVRFSTDEASWNDSGESLFSDRAPVPDAVPPLERTAVRWFTVVKGDKPCVGDSRDCDGDGRYGESDVDDRDGDGWPDDCDLDADGDEIPDAADGPPGAPDTDGDGTFDWLDTDADGDGAGDADDPAPGAGQYELRPSTLELSTCGPTRDGYLLLDTDVAVTAARASIQWDGADDVQLESITLGPDVEPGTVSLDEVRIEQDELGPGQAQVELSVLPGTRLGPAQNLRLLTLHWSVDQAGVGVSVDVCPEHAGGDDSRLRLADGSLVTPASPCGAIEVVGDTVRPELTCPADATRVGDAQCTVEWSGTASVQDGCDAGVTVVSDPAVPLRIRGDGTYPIGYTATDASGNRSSCVTRLTVECP